MRQVIAKVVAIEGNRLPNDYWILGGKSAATMTLTDVRDLAKVFLGAGQVFDFIVSAKPVVPSYKANLLDYTVEIEEVGKGW